jgi:hypothetical protein
MTELTGQRFGRFQVLWAAGYKQRSPADHKLRLMWAIQCDCGHIAIQPAHEFTRGRLLTYDCNGGDHGRKQSGLSRSREYSAYHSARNRCLGDYKKLGIEFRFHSFAEFYAELGPRPSGSHSVDRKNNHGHYELGNVRWATPKEQANNRDHHQLKKTHCPSGHPYDEQNTRCCRGRRYCRACMALVNAKLRNRG